jgi:hypothetical protein
MIIYDPSLISTKDISEPGPGKLVRTRRPAWGKGVDGAIKQLKAEDITGGNIADSSFLSSILDTVAGSVDPLKGIAGQRTTRISASEARGIQTGALSRMERIARMISVQQMRDLGYLIASQTQQFAEEETWVYALGTWPRVVADKRKMVNVRPADLYVEYDVVEKDGSVPNSHSADAWVQVLQAVVEHPVLLQQFDLGKVFKHVARMLGAKNVDDFVRVETRGDEEVARDVERGNLVPLPEQGGA